MFRICLFKKCLSSSSSCTWKNAIVNETEKYYETFSRLYGFFVSDSEDHRRRFFLLVSLEVLQNFLLQFLQSFALQAINHHDGISFFFFSACEKQKTSSTNLIFVFGDLSQIFNALWCLISRSGNREAVKGSIKVHPSSLWPTIENPTHMQ